MTKVLQFSDKEEQKKDFISETECEDLARIMTISMVLA